MPTYEYKCKNCDYVYEVFHKISQDPLTQCPKCNQNSLQRLVGGSQAILNFKGSGFYITDYSKKNRSESENKE